MKSSLVDSVFRTLWMTFRWVLTDGLKFYASLNLWCTSPIFRWFDGLHDNFIHSSWSFLLQGNQIPPSLTPTSCHAHPSICLAFWYSARSPAGAYMGFYWTYRLWRTHLHLLVSRCIREIFIIKLILPVTVCHIIFGMLFV